MFNKKNYILKGLTICFCILLSLISACTIEEEIIDEKEAIVATPTPNIFALDDEEEKDFRTMDKGKFGKTVVFYEAEDFDNHRGLRKEERPNPLYTNHVLAYVRNGHYTSYKQVDFGKGVTGFSAHVCTETSGGTIEIRLGRLNGELVGKCNVGSTGTWSSYITVNCDLDKQISGVHDLFLVYIGNDNQYLFNIDWFEFYFVEE